MSIRVLVNRLAREITTIRAPSIRHFPRAKHISWNVGYSIGMTRLTMKCIPASHPEEIGGVRLGDALGREPREASSLTFLSTENCLPLSKDKPRNSARHFWVVLNTPARFPFPPHHISIRSGISIRRLQPSIIVYILLHSWSLE
jgi:hypothetical protein